MPDYHACAQSLFRALESDPFYRSLAQSVDDQAREEEAMLAYYTLSMEDAARWGRLTLPDDGAYGAAVWSVPLAAKAAAERRAVRQEALARALGPGGAAAYQRMDASISEREAEMKLEGLWYLSILGVDPGWQGRGLGAQLVRPVLDEADAAGVASFLTTFSPGNIQFYEGIGFERRANFDDPVTGHAFTLLIRPARPPS